MKIIDIIEINKAYELESCKFKNVFRVLKKTK